MKKISTLLLIIFVGCLATYAEKKKRMPMPEATEEWDILARKEFQKQRDAFLANDSVATSLNDLGWANGLQTDVLLPKDKKHSFVMPFGMVFHKAAFGSSVEFSPCGESVDSEDYWSQHAVAVHKNLDSALVIVKRKAIARLFMRAAHSIWSETEGHNIDSTQYNDLYAAYMQQAEFDCIAVNQDHKGNYIVYATLQVPRAKETIEISDEQMLQILFQMAESVHKEKIKQACESKTYNTNEL